MFSGLLCKRRELWCRVFGHRRWYYVPEGASDRMHNIHGLGVHESMVFGCVRCKSDDEITDRIVCWPVPDHPDFVSVDPRALERLRTRLEMLSG